MAYPTGVNFVSTSDRVGAQPIDKASTSAAHRIGETVEAVDTTRGAGEFIYLPGVASGSKGYAVTYNTVDQSVALTAGSSAGPAAVAMADIGVGQFGWYCTRGNVPVACATVVAGASCYPTSTPGQWDDAATLSIQVSGAKFTSASSGGFASVQLSGPSVELAASGGTGITGFAAVGSTPTAAAASVSGGTATLQPANGFFSGVMLAADKTKLDTYPSSYAAPAVTIGAFGSSPNANAATSSGMTVTMQPVDATRPGAMVATDKVKLDTYPSSYAAPAVTIGTFGSAPDPKAATASGLTVTMQPADSGNPGAVTTGAQTLAGPKTWTSAAVFQSTASITGALTGAGATFSATVAAPNFFERYPRTEHWAPVGATNQAGTAGNCYLQRIRIKQACKIDQISYLLGTTPGGNVYAGVYGPETTTDQSVGCTLVSTSASTAGAGTTNNMQALAQISPPTIQPGTYFIALHVDGASVQWYRHQQQRTSSGVTTNTIGAGNVQLFNQTFGALPGVIPTLSAGGGNSPNEQPVLEVRCIP